MFSKKDIISLLIPLIIEQTLAVTVGIADIVMVASVGEAAVSGVSLVDTINMLLSQVFAALATGGAIVVAQYLGRQNKPSACEAAKQLYNVMAAIGISVSVICVVWHSEILTFFYKAIEPAVMQSAQHYFLATALSYPFFSVYNSGAALFRAQGNSRISMLTALVMNTLNIAGNALLGYHYNMGVLGIGISTLLSRIAGAVIMMWLIKNPHNTVYIDKFFPLNIKPKMISTILHIGVPTGLENGMFHFGKLMVAGLVASFGTVAITANAVGNSIATLACIPGSAIGLGMITIVGQCMGAGERAQAKKYIKLLMKIAYVIGGATNIIVLLTINQLVAAFGVSELTAELAAIISCIHAGVWLVFWPTAFTLPNGLRAAGDVRFSMVVSVIIMWTCRIGLSYVFALYFGWELIGVWIAMTIDWVARTVLYVWRFYGQKWQSHVVI